MVDTGKCVNILCISTLKLFVLGSTLLFLPKHIINRVFRGVKGLKMDNTGQYLVPCHAKNLPDITLNMNGVNFVVKPEHYVITTGPVSYTYSSGSVD